MIVAINAIFFSKENELIFFKKVIDALIIAHPEHTFLWITTDETENQFPPNVQLITAGHPPEKINRWFFWNYFKLKQIFKKYPPDLFINNGQALYHFRKIPQLVFNPDLRFISDPKSVSAGFRRVSELFAPRYFQKVSRIILLSEYEKNIFKKKFRPEEQKLSVIPFGAQNELKPVGFEERERVKETFAKGFEYFLYTGYINPSDHLLTLLKSFSAFKKRQRSSMQLILIGQQGRQYLNFKKMLESYRYKDDIHLLTDMNHNQHEMVVSSAYALIFPGSFDKQTHLLLTALKFEVPCIVPAGGSLSETGRDAVLIFEPGSIADLAGKMMHIFKDEKARKKLIENAIDWTDNNNFEKDIQITWEIVGSLA